MTTTATNHVTAAETNLVLADAAATHIADAEHHLVAADAAEEAGNEGLARLEARIAGSHYESAGELALAAAAYRRGGAIQRAERCEVAS